MKTPRATLSSVCLVLMLSAEGLHAQAVVADVPALQAMPQTDSWAEAWWMPRHLQKVKEVQSAETVNVLMIGDSITHGWENTGQAVWQEFYAPRHAVNLGFSGDRTEQVLWRLRNGEVEGLSPQLAIVMIGTNNTGHRQDPPADTAAGIRKIMEELRARMPDMKILLLAVFPRDPNPDGPLRAINDRINGLIQGYADGSTVTFLDINRVFLDDQGRLPESIMPDFLHPNAEGYRKWAEAMEPTVRKLLGEE